MRNMKSVLAAGASAIVAATEAVQEFGEAAKPASEPKKAARKPRQRKVLPSNADLKKMSREKRVYWQLRHAARHQPRLNKRWFIQFMSGRSGPVNLAGSDPTISRQVRRHIERREFKMPVGVTGEVWNRRIAQARKQDRQERMEATA